MPRRVLVVTEDPLGEMLGGAAIRAFEMARSLTDVAEVTLAAPGSEPPGLAPVTHVPFELEDPRALRPLVREADVVIMRPPNPLMAGWLRRSSARIVFDLCDPLPLDILEAQASAPREQQILWHTIALDHFLGALHTGHHFICSGRRQRDLYIGALLGSRLIHPAAYAADPTFRTFVERVPFGIPATPPERVPGAGPGERSRCRRSDPPVERRHMELARPMHGRRSDREGRRTLPARTPRIHVCQAWRRARTA